MSNMEYTEEQLSFKDKYNLTDSDFWPCHGKPVTLHSTCEKIALKEGITSLDMDIVECDSEKRLVVIKCIGKLGDRVEVSYGEANPKNTNSAYPVAMAEKRAVDRCILKLLNAHAYIYSDSESVDFKEPAGNKAKPVAYNKLNNVEAKLNDQNNQH